MIKIIYEDDHMFAVDKPAGLISVPGPNIPEHKTVQGIVRRQLAEAGKDYKSYLLNRLDRETSGIMLFGKYPRDREALEGIFKHQVSEPSAGAEKTYLALVKGTPRFPQSTINFFLESRGKKEKIPAVTHYRILKQLGILSMLEVKIETGRKHQIRKHLAAIGNPLVLDREYGDKKFNEKYRRLTKDKGRYFLHAWRFRFHHPFLNKMVEIEAPASF